MNTDSKPRIGIILGDVAGIGPELVAKLLSDESVFDKAKIVLITDQRHWEAGVRIARTTPRTPMQITQWEEIPTREEDFLLLHLPGVDPASVPMGKVDSRAGKYVLESILFTLELIKKGLIHGFLFAPLNKESMHKGGSPFGSELDLLKHHLPNHEALEEINILDEYWTMRVTSHVAFRDVPSLITPEGVYRAIRFLHRAMVSYGKQNPRIGVAALNPHGGEHGLFGDEEQTKIEPGIRKAQQEGIMVSGPYPADTIFLKLRDGALDGIISMYHDQGQIATKLLGFNRGVTYHAGFSVPITTPAHGTAFDIAGKGIADPGATRHAFYILCRIAQNRTPHP
ncbi:MAG: 4-hydroxythreonine-4-phosphate dehydrogenase PdxA [Spirochaetes bacterium]|nr:4-hydroxythreonine-4-phosphate dehydrogenase PdxA [Spirochaetota bacterium]